LHDAADAQQRDEPGAGVVQARWEAPAASRAKLTAAPRSLAKTCACAIVVAIRTRSRGSSTRS